MKVSESLLKNLKEVTYYFLCSMYTQSPQALPMQAMDKQMFQSSVSAINSDRKKAAGRILNDLQILSFELRSESEDGIVETRVLYTADGKLSDGFSERALSEKRSADVTFRNYARGGFMMTSYRDIPIRAY